MPQSFGTAAFFIERWLTLKRKPMITTPSGLNYEDTVLGDGAEAAAGQHVTVH